MSTQEMTLGRGHNGYQAIDLAGMKFGRLTTQWPVGRVGKRSATRVKWLASCECGVLTIVQSNNLRSGGTRSCGCLSNEVRSLPKYTFHGHARKGSPTRTYNSWSSMLKRCTDTNAADYPRYGGRGIKVCTRWLAFKNFLADMGERPLGKTLDRFPNPSGDYEPKNCRWATIMEQQATRRNTRSILRNVSLAFVRSWGKESSYGNN